MRLHVARVGADRLAEVAERFVGAALRVRAPAEVVERAGIVGPSLERLPITLHRLVQPAGHRERGREVEVG